jgi:hypothetical protein
VPGSDIVTLAHDVRNEVHLCAGVTGTNTVVLDVGRVQPVTLAVIETIEFADLEAWQKANLPWFVPFQRRRLDKSKERAWLRANAKHLWCMNIAGGVHFADQTDGFWYKMYRG